LRCPLWRSLTTVTSSSNISLVVSTETNCGLCNIDIFSYFSMWNKQIPCYISICVLHIVTSLCYQKFTYATPVMFSSVMCNICASDSAVCITLHSLVLHKRCVCVLHLIGVLEHVICVLQVTSPVFNVPSVCHQRL